MKTLREIFLETIDKAMEIADKDVEDSWFRDFKINLIYGWLDKDVIKVLEQRGIDGEGYHTHVVFEYKGVTYKAVAPYESYNGMDVDYMEDNFKVVNPVQKTTTVWE
jgi:hypothetical protein